MARYKTYIGTMINLEHYKAASVRDFEFEILDVDGEAFDLSIYDFISLKIFAKRHGTALATFSTQVPYPTLEITDNVISWDGTRTAMDLRVSEYYYHECRGRLPGGEEDILFHGPSEVI